MSLGGALLSELVPASCGERGRKVIVLRKGQG
jgi:hypothetical protein